MQVAVSYRERGHAHWLEAHTVNLSRTGLMMECRSGPSIGAPLDLLLMFEPPLATISCSARVVRAEHSALTNRWRVGAGIFRYVFLRKPQPYSDGPL